MDINVIWVPKALEAIRTILSALRLQGIIYTMLDSLAPEIQGTVLHEYMQNPSLLDDHIAKWRSAKEFFRTTISGETARQRIDAKLSSLTEGERRHWSGVLNGTKDMNQGIAFLALALDSLGKAIPVVNTDPATLLFLDDFIANLVRGAATTAEVEEIVHPFVVPYPLGLYVAGVGPLVANDAYASREVWEAFEYDQYHSPRAVWGREVNLFMLGVCKQLVAAEHVTSGPAEARVSALAHSLRDALYTVRTAVEASGLQHSELWSYVIEGGTAVSARYPASCDIQLWNLTDLAVQFELDHLPR
jgi:hypothetical protein